MPLKLYYTIASCPSRAVIHTLNILNIPHERINVNLRQREQFSEEFLKLNPCHTVPTIVDEDGFVLWESHAINAYLVEKYGNDDNKLYPKDRKIRAIVDQKLFFHSGVLFLLQKEIFHKVAKEKSITKITDELKNSVKAAYELLETFLSDGRQFITGNNVTIADLSILCTLGNLSTFVPICGKAYLSIIQYVKRGEASIPGFEEVEKEGNHVLRGILKTVNFEFEK